MIASLSIEYPILNSRIAFALIPSSNQPIYGTLIKVLKILLSYSLRVSACNDGLYFSNTELYFCS